MSGRLSEVDFVKVRDLLAAKAGLVFDESRRDSLGYSLKERMGACGANSVDQYLLIVGSPDGHTELQALLNEVTIQETHFFRNPPQFRALRKHVLPQLIKQQLHGKRTLRIWSAGCSTGEEPYSVAMLIREILPLTDAWDIRIVGSDISTRALESARVGRYTERALAVADEADVRRWFTEDSGAFVVRPEIRQLVEFRHHNLVTDPPPFEPDEKVDLILCRNVTIYFGRETTRALMIRFHDLLADGGYLFLGHSETLWHLNDRFRLVTLGDAFVYRRDSLEELVQGERRAVLPDRRTGGTLPAEQPERRAHRPDRRSAWEVLKTPLSELAKPRAVHDQPTPPDLVAAEPRPPEAAMGIAPIPQGIDAVRAALRLGRYEAAVELAAEEVRSDPLLPDAHYLGGLALANLGRDADALVELRKAVYLDPNAGFAQFLLAGALSRLGDPDGAARSYRAAADALSLGGESARDLELEGRQVSEIIELCRQLGAGRARGRA